MLSSVRKTNKNNYYNVLVNSVIFQNIVFVMPQKIHYTLRRLENVFLHNRHNKERSNLMIDNTFNEGDFILLFLADIVSHVHLILENNPNMDLFFTTVHPLV